MKSTVDWEKGKTWLAISLARKALWSLPLSCPKQLLRVTGRKGSAGMEETHVGHSKITRRKGWIKRRSIIIIKMTAVRSVMFIIGIKDQITREGHMSQKTRFSSSKLRAIYFSVFVWCSGKGSFLIELNPTEAPLFGTSSPPMFSQASFRTQKKASFFPWCFWGHGTPRVWREGCTFGWASTAQSIRFWHYWVSAGTHPPSPMRPFIFIFIGNKRHPKLGEGGRGGGRCIIV